MAKLLYGTQVTDITGSIGGLTFQKNLTGPICRLKPSNSYVSSEAQLERSNIFSQAVFAYRNLSAANKALWKAFAAAHPRVNYYGEEKILNGQNWFVSCYINSITCSLTPLTAPPTWSVPAAPPVADFTVFDTSYPVLGMTFENTYDYSGLEVILFASPMRFSDSIADRSSIFYLSQFSNGSAGSFDFYTAYSNFWLSMPDFQVEDTLPVFIISALVAIDRTSRLSSAATFYVHANPSHN